MATLGDIVTHKELIPGDCFEWEKHYLARGIVAPKLVLQIGITHVQVLRRVIHVKARPQEPDRTLLLERYLKQPVRVISLSYLRENLEYER